MTEKKYKIIFMGTPDFAVPGLKAIYNDSRFEIISVVTQKDKPMGRKQELFPTSIKKIATEFNLPVLQPNRLKNISAKLKSLAPDFIVVIAYGQILNQEILSIPKVACINVHASLLPKYRGASCIQAPILNGDSETGVTIMLMDSGLDTGDILRQEKIVLNSNETLEMVHNELSELGAKILGDTLVDFAEGKITPQKQDNSLSSYVTVTYKKDGQINWREKAMVIERKIRAFNPWPGTFTYLNGKLVKINKAKVMENKSDFAIGQIFTQNKELLVKCGQNALHILELQLEGKKATDSQSFLAGHTNIVGQKFE